MPNYTPHLDRRQELSSGSHSAGTTTWTLAVGDGSIDTLIIGSGASIGEVVPITSLNVATYPYTVAVSGNYNGESAVVGASFEASLTPTNPFRLRQDGSPDFSSRVTVRTVDVRCHRSGPYSIDRSMISRGTATRTFTSSLALQAMATENKRFNLNGNTDDATWRIYTDGPRRMVISSVEFLVDLNTRRDG